MYHNRGFSWDYIDRVLIVLHDISINSADGRAVLYGIYHKCMSMHKRHMLLSRRIVKKKHKFTARRTRMSNIMKMREKMYKWYSRRNSKNKKHNSKKHNIEKHNSNKYNSNKYKTGKGDKWRYQNYFSGQNYYFVKRRPTYVPDLYSLLRTTPKKADIPSTSTPVKRTSDLLNGTDALAASGTFIHRKYRHVAYRHKRVKHFAGRAHTFTRIRKIRNISWTHIMKRSINRRLVMNCFMNSLVCHPEMFMCYDRYILIISLKHVRLHMCVDYHGIDFTNKMLQTDLADYFNKINIHG